MTAATLYYNYLIKHQFQLIKSLPNKQLNFKLSFQTVNLSLNVLIKKVLIKKGLYSVYGNSYDSA